MSTFFFHIQTVSSSIAINNCFRFFISWKEAWNEILILPIYIVSLLHPLCTTVVIPGSDCVSWIQSHYKFCQEREAVHFASLLASHGYIFPIDEHVMTVRNDTNTLYRFQTAYFWPSHCWAPENTDYAVYLCKRTMQNKVRPSDCGTPLQLNLSTAHLLGAAPAGRLRSGKPCSTSENVLQEVGVHLHAGGGPGQGGQEERQAGTEDPGQSGESILGRVQAAPGAGQHHRDGHQENVQTKPDLRSGTNTSPWEQSAQQTTCCSSGKRSDRTQSVQLYLSTNPPPTTPLPIPIYISPRVTFSQTFSLQRNL